MVKIIQIAFLLLFVLAGDTFAETFTVKKVIDGDIFELSDGKIVRLIGIDAPDSRPTSRAKMFAQRSGKKLEDILAVGKRARKFVQKLIEGKKVRLEFDRQEKDQDGNLWAYVYEVGSESLINAKIVESGYATPQIIPPNVKFSKRFKELFNQAQTNKRGLWE